MISAQHTSTECQQTTRFALLSLKELAEVHGGAIRVLVDGGPSTATVDDFALNMEIFKGNIGGPMIL